MPFHRTMVDDLRAFGIRPIDEISARKPSGPWRSEILRSLVSGLWVLGLWVLGLWVSGLWVGLWLSVVPALAAQPAVVPDDPRSEVETLRLEIEGEPGGRLVVGLRAEPKTFNPVVASDNPSRTVIRRLMADLIHINRASQNTEPALARRWTVSDDGLRYRLELRRGLRFSDGEPFDADDVVFTFQVHLDPAVGSTNRDLLVVGGEPIEVRRLDSHTVEFVLAQPYAAGERLFDSVAILPRHRLETAYRQGRLADAWGVATTAEEIVGLGPFRLKQRLPGERIELERNPYYWKVDRHDHTLPYLDRLIFLVVGDGEAEALRFASGDLDLISGFGAQTWRQLAAGQERGGYLLQDLGPGLRYDFLFFNLNDLGARGEQAEGGDGPLATIARRQRWFSRVEFRRAVSAAVDRRGIVRLVYGGLATPIASQVTPGNRLWRNEDLALPERSLAEAERWLASAGFRRRSNGALYDEQGVAVEFSILTSSSNAERLQIGTILQEDLRQLGIEVRLVPIEFRALVERVTSTFEYEACLLALGGGDVDPNSGMSVWPTGGANHLWRLARETPPTPWEAEIDRLMQQQLVALDRGARKALYDRVQDIVVEQQPFIFLVSPNVLVGAREGLAGFQPAILDHSTLWNVDQLSWRALRRR